MKKNLLLGASAVVLVFGLAAPASAFSVVQAPRNADGSARYADPDAALDQQLDDYQNGRLGGPMWFGGHASGDSYGRGESQETYQPHRNRHDYTCIDCNSVLVDGLWVLRPAGDDATADSADQSDRGH